MHKLRLYNSATNTLEFFEPLNPDLVGMYCCGPTVYSFAHIGNMRSSLFEDFLRRTLEANGYTVKHVQNITDVGHLTEDDDDGEDKMELAADTQQMSAELLARSYTEAYLADCKALNVLHPNIMPKATEHIGEMIALIKILEEKGYAYKTSDGVYFDTSRFAGYGQMANLMEQEMEEGARVEKNPERRNLHDFALWKLSPKGSKRQMEWGSPWGTGFPGWHIECSAMAMRYLGETFDIHCGGIDLKNLHHPNEIAQSEAATGKPFARYWLHGAFLVLKDDARMGKSEGNAITLATLAEKKYPALAFRYLCLTTHYRKPLQFSWEALDAAKNALVSLQEKIAHFPTPKVGIAEFEERFMDAVNDDLNMPRALAVLWDMLKSDYPDERKHQAVLFMDRVLGLDLSAVEPIKVPTKVKTLVQQREDARDAKDFALSDKLRNQIEGLGFTVEDTAKGPVIRKS